MYLVGNITKYIEFVRERKCVSERVATRRIATFDWWATGPPHPLPSPSLSARASTDWLLVSRDRICWPSLLGTSLTHWSMVASQSVLVVSHYQPQLDPLQRAITFSSVLLISSFIKIRLYHSYRKMHGEKHTAKICRNEKRRVRPIS